LFCFQVSWDWASCDETPVISASSRSKKGKKGKKGRKMLEAAAITA
jgi:hypothetical protein